MTLFIQLNISESELFSLSYKEIKIYPYLRIVNILSLSILTSWCFQKERKLTPGVQIKKRNWSLHWSLSYNLKDPYYPHVYLSVATDLKLDILCIQSNYIQTGRSSLILSCTVYALIFQRAMIFNILYLLRKIEKINNIIR